MHMIITRSADDPLLMTSIVPAQTEPPSELVIVGNAIAALKDRPVTCPPERVNVPLE
jgi:hypothetical protein